MIYTGSMLVTRLVHEKLMLRSPSGNSGTVTLSDGKEVGWRRVLERQEEEDSG